MFFTTFPTVFSDRYGFGPGATGLTYIGGGLGELSSAMIGGIIGDKIYHGVRPLTYISTSTIFTADSNLSVFIFYFFHQLIAQNNGIPRPELRIPAMLPGSITLPIGLFWYGWSAQAHLHWIMPIIGATIFGFGLIATLLPIQMYFVDAFTYSASALAANSALRYTFGFAFPLFGPAMEERLGLGGTYSLLGGLMVLFGVPFPLWVYYHGEKMRGASKWTTVEKVRT